jgi:serine/threonine-protein kinase
MRARVRVPHRIVVVLGWSGLAGASLVVFAASAYLAMRAAIHGSDVEVPRVVALEVDAARRLLAERDLVLESTGSRHSPLFPGGQILSQQPAPGESLRPGRKVKVLVSLGPEDFRSPDLIGTPVARARVLLSQEGLRLGSVAHLHAPGRQENLVLAQDPPAGAAVEKEGRVDLLVSRGSPEPGRVMPDLRGRRLAEARALLERHGFRLGVLRREPESGAPPDRVLRQSPLPGYPVRASEGISLVVSE